jgi:hypothetical protein
MRPQFETVVEPDEQVLALRLDRLDRGPHDSFDLRAGPSGSRPGHRPPDEMGSEPGRSPKERIALGHGFRLSAGRAA